MCTNMMNNRATYLKGTRMSNYPLISIIVPVYNTGKYISECIDSLKMQVYENIEIILVDDGSTDQSGAICDEYAKANNNIYVVHKQNEGLGYARNTGLLHVKGDFVVFVDSDDWVSPDFIINLYNGIRDNAADFCKSGLCRIMSNGSVVSSTSYVNEFFAGKDASQSLFPRLIGSAPDKHDSIEMSACAVMYRVSIIQDNNINFPSEREIISEALVFNMEYLHACNGVVIIDDIDYMYRVNVASLTHTYRPDRFEACMHFYEYMLGRLKEYGYDESVFNRLKRILFVYIRTIIRMEANRPGDSGRIHSIHELCADERMKRMIAGFPIKKLAFRQKMFVIMLKYNMAFLLFGAARVGIV